MDKHIRFTSFSYKACVPSTLLAVANTMRRLSLKFRKSRARKTDKNIGSRAPVDESLLSDAGVIKGDDFSTCALRVAEVTAGVVGGVPVVGGYVGGGMQAIVQQAQVCTSCCLSISADSLLRVARTVWILLWLCANVAMRCSNTFVWGTRQRRCRICSNICLGVYSACWYRHLVDKSGPGRLQALRRTWML